MALPTGIELRVRTGSATGLVEGGAITALPDTSGKAHPDFTQGTAAKQPVARQVTHNGKTFWVADFDGVDDTLVGSGTALDVARATNGVTTFLVARVSGAPAAANTNWFGWSTGGNIGRARITGQTTNDTGATRAGGRRLDADGFASLASTTGYTLNEWQAQTILFEYAAASLTHWVNGSVKVTGAWQTAGSTSDTQSLGGCLGSAPNGTAEFANIDFAEIIIYKRKLTDAERSDVHTYLQNTYGVRVADYQHVASAADTVGTADAVEAVRNPAAFTSRLWEQPGADGTSLAAGAVLDPATGWQQTVAKNTGTDNTATIQGDFIRFAGAPNLARIDGDVGAGSTLLGAQGLFRLDALPVGTPNRLMEIDGSAGNHAARLLVGTDGTLIVQDGSSTNRITGPTIAVGQEYRAFMAAERGASTTTGRVRLLVWTTNARDPADITPDFTGEHTTSDTGVTTELLTHVRTGRQITTAGSSSSDDVLWVQAGSSWEPFTAPTSPAASTVLTASAGDTAGAVGAASRVVAAARELGDAAGTADVAAAALTLPRGAGDAAGTADAAAAALGMARAVADAAGSVDAADRVVSAARGVPDAVGTADAVAAGMVRSVGLADVAGTADAVASAVGASRAVTDAAGSVDAAVSAIAAGRAAADVVGTADAVVAQLATLVGLGDAAGTGDVVSSTVAAVRPVADTVGSVDVAGRLVAATRAAGDAVGTVDQVAAGLVAARGAGDAVGAVDAVSAGLVRTVVLGDVAPAVDAVARTARWAVALGDTVPVVDLARVGGPRTVPGGRALRHSGVNRRLTVGRGATLTLAPGGERRLVPAEGADG